jgi:hypothetical protein
MGWIIEYSVLCDGRDDGCHLSADSDYDKDGATRNAVEAGWYVTRRTRLCPVCRQKSPRTRKEPAPGKT